MKHPNHTHLNDEVLWRQLKQGNKFAFAQLFRRYYNSLYSYGMHLVNNQEELLKDTIQDLFAEIWSKKTRLGDIKHIKTYLFKSFRRNLLRALKRKRRFLLIFDNQQIQPDVFSLSVEDLIIAKETYYENQQKIDAAFHQLTVSQKEIIYLKFKDNLDYEEIEEITKLKYQSIRNNVHRALKTLRAILKVHPTIKSRI